MVWPARYRHVKTYYLRQTLRCSSFEEHLVLIGLEADSQLASLIQYRPLDHRRLHQHQLACLRSIDILTLAIWQFAEGCACTIEQFFPLNVF